jgi:hypothetical protein
LEKTFGASFRTPSTMGRRPYVEHYNLFFASQPCQKDMNSTSARIIKADSNTG